MVAGIAGGLAASASSLSGSLYLNAHCAYLTWTIIFRNSSRFDREARSKIRLPDGAVVTGASIVINGIEQQSQIQLRSQARAIYRAATHTRSAPLLVSTCGPDSLLVQCYPVPPGGALDVKLHISAAFIWYRRFQAQWS